MRIQTSRKAERFTQSFRRGLLGVFALFACALSLSLVRPHQALAATNATINFQARLETASGAIVPDGTYNVEFKLYSAATGGTAAWTEDYTYNSGAGATDARLRVVNGYLTANLGSITSFPGTINWNQQQWVTMNIGGTVSSGTITWDGEMNPRLQLTAVPYAFAAGQLSATDGSNNTGALSFGTVTSNPVITLPNASGMICLQSSSACGFATGSGAAFLQGGNSFGAQGVLGTNDSNSLAIRTAGTNRLVIDTSGNLQLQQASIFNIASAAGGSQLTIQAGANSTAAGTGGTLLLQGGAPGTTGASGAVIVKANTNDSTSAFQVQNASGANLFTVDSQNTALVLGTDGTPTALDVRGGAATGSNAQGANMTFDASNGTGDAGSGDLIFRTSPALANPISLDATSSSTVGSGTTLSWSHTTGSGSNMILIVGVGSDTGPVNSVSSVTYNGVSLARVVSEGCPSSGSNCDEELWYLVNPSPGSHAISVTLGVSGEIFGGAATYYGINTTAPLGTAAVNQGVGGPTYVAVSSNSTQLVIDGVMDPANGSLNSPNAGQTKLWEPNLYGLNSGGSSKPGASGTTTLGWGLNYNSWAEVGVPLNPIPNTASDVLTDRLHIAANGNVGVDNATPQYALDVVGSGNFSTSVLSPVLDAATAVALNIGNTNATAINLGNATSNILTTLNGTVLVKPTTGYNSTTAFQVQNASGSSVLDVDTSNWRVGIGTSSPQALFDVYSASNAKIMLDEGGNQSTIYNDGNLHVVSNSTLWLDSGTTTNLRLNWNASGNVIIAQGGGNVGIHNSSPTHTLDVTGTARVQSATNSTTAFQVQNAAGATILNTDTNNQTLTVTAGSDHLVAGSNLYSGNFSSGWTGTTGTACGTAGWYVGVNTQAQHCTGNTTALVNTSVSVTSGATYEVNFILGGTCATASDTVTVTIGGTWLATLDGTNCHGDTSSYVATASSTAGLTFTPTSNWSETVSGISIVQLTGTINPVLVVQNASAVNNLEVRASSTTNNTFIGLMSGERNTTGSINTAVGDVALQDNTTGTYNAALGAQALQYNTTGSYDTALGAQALQSNSTGTNNTAIGASALNLNTTGAQNTAVGSAALANSTTGVNNSAFGDAALEYNSTGYENTAIGSGALSANATGYDNSALGTGAMEATTTGSGNTSIGSWTMYVNTTGNENTALGYEALLNSASDGNTALGYDALRSNTAGAYDSALGYYAGFEDANGTFSTLANLQNATAIGTYAQVQESNAIVLGSIDNATKVGIGITVPSNTLSVSPLDYQTGQVTRTNSSATLIGTGTTWTSSMVGDIIVFADGTTNTIAAFTDATHITMGTTYTGTTDASPVNYRFHKPGFQVTSAGNAYVQNTSTTAFQVQNAGGTALLTVDTTHLRVIVGAGSTGEATPTLLVVDSETGSSADPSGVNGAIYYNATDNALRCDNNGSWQNCTPGVAYSFYIYAGSATGQSISSAGTIIIAPLYVSGQITVNTLRVSVTTALGAAGDVGVYNAAGTLVLDGGSGSLSTATGVKTITPTQANRTLEPGQYYVAVTWNSTTGGISVTPPTFTMLGMVNRAGTISGGGLVLPASLTLSNIANQAYMPIFSMNN